MTPFDPAAVGDAAVNAALDALCGRGCRYVLKAIEAMEGGDVPPELSPLDPSQRQTALTELKAIMAVYDAPCDAG